MQKTTAKANGPRKSLAKRQFKHKTKTGCLTCRIRRVKCDETKPACDRCTSTQRTCDGYPSVFRIVPSTLATYQPQSSVVTQDQINVLARHFTKYDVVDVSYLVESRATLARLSEPAVRYARISLGTLHHGYETYQNSVGSENHDVAMSRLSQGIDQYNMAVTSLASRLETSKSTSSPSPPSTITAPSILLCCQLFISIEILLEDYFMAVRHFINGLRIIHQFRKSSRSAISGEHHNQDQSHHPYHLDAFVIKLFASGNPAARRGRTSEANKLRPCNAGTIPNPNIGSKTLLPAPDKAVGSIQASRAELSDLSSQTLEFLGQLSSSSREISKPQDQHQQHKQHQHRHTRARLLHILKSWEHTHWGALTRLSHDDDNESNENQNQNAKGTAVRFAAAFSLLLHRVLVVSVRLSMALPNGGEVEEKAPLETDFRILSTTAALATGLRRKINLASGQGTTSVFHGG